MSFFNNITFRKPKTRSLTDNSDESNDDISSKIDGSTSSLPNITSDENNMQIQELQNQIEQLTSQLNSAHEEIKNLNIENTELKNTINTLTTKNDVLKKATKKLTSDVGTPNKSSRTSTPRLNSQIKSQKRRTKKQSFSEKQETVNTSAIQSDNATTQRKYSEDQSYASKKNKLCVVSANKNNKVLSIAQESFKNFQVCHYISPNCGTLQLVNDLHKKLVDYSMSDYCVILIGEEDFLHTGNYVNIIVKLREALMAVQNTNVILCVPTFKLSNYSTMFNMRIETFNNLLHLDLQTYNYAIAFDSNLNLFYDYTMFSKLSGKINDRGMCNIFQNLILTITDDRPLCESSVCEKFYEHNDLFRV